jgi:hypothetical protein
MNNSKSYLFKAKKHAFHDTHNKPKTVNSLFHCLSAVKDTVTISMISVPDFWHIQDPGSKNTTIKNDYLPYLRI